MGYFNFFLFVLAVFALPISLGVTDSRDAFAITDLYVALGSPQLTGWTLAQGDPCGQAWQGVICVGANVTGIVLKSLNLSGRLPRDLGFLSSITQIDLGDNHIGGPIPSSLPPTLRTIDFSGNKLIGQLPSSMRNLTSLSTLHLQNNMLTGKLDVLEDLPLTDLNIANNIFSGPIPENLLRIPNFRKDGNAFNTTILSAPPHVVLLPPILSAPPHVVPLPPILSAPPHVVPLPPMRRRRNVLWTVGIVLLTTILVSLVACLLLLCYQKRHSERVPADRTLDVSRDEFSIEVETFLDKEMTLAPMDSSNFHVDSGHDLEERHHEVCMKAEEDGQPRRKSPLQRRKPPLHLV